MNDGPIHERFADLWKRMGAVAGAREVCDDLLRAYGEPHRHYHDLSHLRDCLAQLDTAPTTGPARDLAETAIWFHDAVYVPGSPDNEARSAAWASRAVVEAGAAETLAHEVARLVQLTDHARPAEDPVGALVCDVDLSILGRSPAEFAEYERRIRAEYDRVPEPLYRKERASILAGLLARRPLYCTDHFRARYEAVARQNLKRSIGRLGTEQEPQ